VISAKRTAASAALAADLLLKGVAVKRAGVIGCGVINFEIAHFLRAVFPSIDSFAIHDLDPARASHFGGRCAYAFPGIATEILPDASSVLNTCRLVSVATNTVTPHIDDISACPPGSVILNISLRDFTPNAILSCDNVVDDIDHVCRAETSVHLTE